MYAMTKDDLPTPPVELLAQQGLFNGLPVPTLKALVVAGRTSRHAQGAYVFHEGERRPPGLNVLLTGCLQISKLASSGKETIMRLIRPGEMFGSLVLFGEPVMPATALVLEEAQVFSIERDRFLALTKDRPELALVIMQSLCERLLDTQNRLHAMASERAPNRLAQVLVQEARREGIGGGVELQERLSYKQLAQMCGITYEETVRIMRGWVEAGYLTYQRGGRITLLDFARLSQLAAGHLS